MRGIWLLAPLAVAAAGPGAGAAEQPLRFWNQTAATIDELYMAPAGTEKWGPNQCLNDKDKTVDADERLKLAGIEPGRYDVRLHDEKGRRCLVKDVEVRSGGKYAFEIEEKQLTDCERK